MANPNGPIVFLLRPATTFSEFQRIADLYGWRIVREAAGDNYRTAFEQIRVTPDGSTAIHYLADPTPKERFLLIYGPQTRAVAFNVGRSFETESSTDVFERVREAASDDEKAAGAYQLAVVFRSYNDEAMNLLRSFYDGGVAAVRYAVINALGYAGWPESRALLERIANDDPEPSLRENARAIVDARWGADAAR
jgi:hypothetical protein